MKSAPTYGTSDPGPLFRLPPAAARNDPETSHVAARKITRSGKRQTDAQRVAVLVEMYPGRTNKELAATPAAKLMELDYYTIARRQKDAETMGLVKRDGVRDGATIWWPK